MKKIKITIIDDEPLARELLKNYISKVEFIELVGEFKSINDYLVNSDLLFDLLILDINMPKISGLEYIKTNDVPIPFILSTAYREFAIDAFELNAIDYLVKPFSFERFLKAINKAKNTFSNNFNQIKETNSLSKDYFFVKSNNKLIKISFDDILYIEALAEYVKIVTNSQSYLTLLRMKDLEENLPNDNFYRVHRSYLVAINKIDFIKGNIINIKNKEINISREVKEDFIKFISNM